MDAVKFLKEKGRMCNHFKYENACFSCRLSATRNGTDMGCVAFSHKYPESAVIIVEEWSKANKPFTNEDKFQEVFGKTSDDKDLYLQEWWDSEYKEPYHVPYSNIVSITNEKKTNGTFDYKTMKMNVVPEYEGQEE